MAKTKSTIAPLKRNKELKINFIPVYESNILFQERRKVVQQFIAKMITIGSKRGRPAQSEVEEVSNAA